jgi:NAD-dependent SIR2 family protein deacetylase
MNKALDIINSSQRIIVLCGAGLSAPSGLPVFRGQEGLYSRDFGEPG